MGLFFVHFRSFSNKQTLFTTNQSEKCHVHRVWPRDLNPWPLKHESSPITTRPGLPPSTLFCFLMLIRNRQTPNLECENKIFNVTVKFAAKSIAVSTGPRMKRQKYWWQKKLKIEFFLNWLESDSKTDNFLHPIISSILLLAKWKEFSP